MLIALVILGVLVIALMVTGVSVQSRANERLLIAHDSESIIALLMPWASRLKLGQLAPQGEQPLPICSEEVASGHGLTLSAGMLPYDRVLEIKWSVPWRAISTPDSGLALNSHMAAFIDSSLDNADAVTSALVLSPKLLALIEPAARDEVTLSLWLKDGTLTFEMKGHLPEILSLMEPVTAWLLSIPEQDSSSWSQALESWSQVRQEEVARTLLEGLRSDQRCDEAALIEAWAAHPCELIAALLALEHPYAAVKVESARLYKGIAQGLLRDEPGWPSRARWLALIKSLDIYGEVLDILGARLLATSRAQDYVLFMKLDERILSILGEAEHGKARLSRALIDELLAQTIAQEDVSRVPIIGVHVGASQIVSVMARLWSLELDEVRRMDWARVLVMHCRDEIAAQVLDALYKSFMMGNQEAHALTRLSVSIAQCDPPLAWLRKMRSALGGARESQLNQLSEEIWQRLSLRVSEDGVVSDQEREAFFKGGALLMRRARATDALFKLWREQFIDDPRAPKALLEALIGLSSQVSTMGWGSAPQQQLDSLSALLVALKVDWSAHEAAISLWCKLMCFDPLMVPSILALHQAWANLLPAREVAAPIEEELAKGGIKMKPQAWFPLWRWAIEQEQLGALPSLAGSAHDEVLDELPKLERAPSFESLWAAMRAAPPLMWALLCPFVAQAPYLQSERELYLLEALHREERVSRDAALEALASCGSLEVVMPLMALTQGVFVSGELKLYVQRAVAQIQKRHGGTRADGALSLAVDPDERGALSLAQGQGGLKIVEEDPP